jgi:hypothetical protein
VWALNSIREVFTFVTDLKQREIYTRIAVVFPSRTERLACTVYLLRSFPVPGSVTSRANKENCTSLTANRTCVRTVLVRWPSAQHCRKILRVSNHRFSAIDRKRGNKQLVSVRPRASTFVQYIPGSASNVQTTRIALW